MNNRILSVILLISLGLVWGSGYAIARFAVTNGVTPLGYTFWQCLGQCGHFIFVIKCAKN